jgi:formamidopyrimidine-DNA glycosylase
MPELPDILLYQHSLEQRVRGQPIERIRLGESLPAPQRRTADQGSRGP